MLAAIILCCLQPSFAQTTRHNGDVETGEIVAYVQEEGEDQGALTSGAIEKGDLLFSDNFTTSKIGGGWGSSSDANYSRYYKDGKYIMEVNQLNSWRKVGATGTYDDFVYEVEANPVGGPDDNAYGVIFRKLDWNNYYVFLISGDGYYQFAKYINGQWSSAMWKYSDAIKKGKVTNLITVVCSGDVLTFYVNGIKVDQVTEGSIQEGGIGLLAGTGWGGANVSIAFDNISVWETGYL